MGEALSKLLALSLATCGWDRQSLYVRPVEVEVDAYEDILGTLEVGNVRKQSNDIIWVDLDVDGKPLKMELDTCMAVSIISFDLYQQKFNRLTLHDTGPSL